MRIFHYKEILAIILIGFLFYFTSLFIGFIGDDQNQIVKALLVHSIKNIPIFFISSIPDLQNSGIFFGFYYRPLMFVYFSILYTFSGGNPIAFHAFQITLHAVNAILIFYFFKNIFFRKIAFFLALIFLLHPINNETVTHIAFLQDILFFFFGISALLLARYDKAHKIWRIFLVTFLLLFSLFSKETGILWIFLLCLYFLLFQRHSLQKYILPFGFVTAIYGIFRIIASQRYFVPLLSSPLSKFSFIQRMRYFPEVNFFYIKEFFLQTHVSYKMTISLFIVFLWYAAIAFIGLWLWKGNKKNLRYFIFFFFWYFSGIGFHSQIIPLDTLVAKHFFYFPLVGVLGITGLGIQQLISHK